MTVIQTEHLSPAAAQWLADRAELVVADTESQTFAEAAPRATALVVRTYTQVNDALLARLPALRAVGRAGVGLDLDPRLVGSSVQAVDRIVDDPRDAYRRRGLVHKGCFATDTDTAAGISG